MITEIFNTYKEVNLFIMENNIKVESINMINSV